MNIVTNIILGIVGSLIATFLLWIFGKYIYSLIKKRNEKKTIKNIGLKCYNSGLTKFHFSRDDYGRTLSTFLNGAKRSIEIVSVTLKVTNETGNLTDLFKRKLMNDSNFIIKISVRNPKNRGLIKLTAKSLGISDEKLKNEIEEMLNELKICYNSLPELEKSRFQISVHDIFPIGSVIMLDATPESGMIQIETKLFDAPRNDSFGFQLTRNSDFFKKNYISWQKIINNSKRVIK